MVDVAPRAATPTPTEPQSIETSKEEELAGFALWWFLVRQPRLALRYQLYGLAGLAYRLAAKL